MILDKTKHYSFVGELLELVNDLCFRLYSFFPYYFFSTIHEDILRSYYVLSFTKKAVLAYEYR